MEEPNDTNRDFVEGLRKGSHAVFEKVFKNYYPDLYRFAYSYLMNRTLAEDMVQDVFTALWSKATTLSPDTRLRHYLYSSVKHACFDYFKHIHIMDTHQDKLTESLVFSGTTDYEDNQELLEKINSCLQQLSEQQRRILELKITKGLNYKEIAKELNISETTVHTHVKRAYQTIRETLPILYLFIRIQRKGLPSTLFLCPD